MMGVVAQDHDDQHQGQQPLRQGRAGAGRCEPRLTPKFLRLSAALIILNHLKWTMISNGFL